MHKVCEYDYVPEKIIVHSNSATITLSTLIAFNENPVHTLLGDIIGLFV